MLLYKFSVKDKPVLPSPSTMSAPATVRLDDIKETDAIKPENVQRLPQPNQHLASSNYSAKGLTGLENYSNNCYMNAVVQGIMMIM